MLLVGPGYGHNTEGRLKGLSESDDFDVYFYSNVLDKSFVKKYRKIHFLSPEIYIRKKHPLKTLASFFNSMKLVRSKYRFDVIYVLGMGGFFMAFLYFFARKETKKVFELWSNHIIWSAKNNKTFKEKCDKYVINHSDFICQYWWGVRELFVKSFPEMEEKFLMYQLSYGDILFSNEKLYPESDFVKNFLNRIPDNQKVCFWPRSFIPSNNHKLLLESLGLLKKESPDLMVNFKLYLWGGNVEYVYVRKEIEDTISTNNLGDNVEIVEHPFVPRNDIFAIEQRSDFFVQIANDDIFSSYIMEMLCSRKPFLLSNIRTFQFLNEKYDLKIDLVENEKRIIADRIIKILLGNIDYAELEWRKKRCSQLFSRSYVMPWYTILYNTIKK